MPDLSLTYDFKHSPERMFAILSQVEDHSRFMPFCRESRIVSASQGRRKFNVLYVLSSRKYGFRREFGVVYEVEPDQLAVVTRSQAQGTDGIESFCKIVFQPGEAAGSRAMAEIRYAVPRGPLRLVPLGPLVGRSFKKIMEAMAKRADDTAGAPKARTPGPRYGT